VYVCTVYDVNGENATSAFETMSRMREKRVRERSNWTSWDRRALVGFVDF